MFRLINTVVVLILMSTTASLVAQQNDSGSVFPLKRLTKLPDAIQMHGTAVVGKRIYLFGGGAMAIGWSDRVYSAEIGSGDLGGWREEGRMPERRGYIEGSVEVVNNRIYIVGGVMYPAADTPPNKSVTATDALWTTVLPDGRLGPWKRSASFPNAARTNTATCASDQHLFMTGGRHGTGIHDEVFAAEFDSEGNPTRWRQAGKLPVPLWYHGAAVMDDYMYIWGGLSTPATTAVNNKIFMAPLRGGGAIGEWEEVGLMPTPVYSSAFCGFNDHLICIAGREAGGEATSAIWFTRLQNRRPTTWNMLNTDLDAKIYMSLGLDKTRGWVFVTGGKTRSGSGSRGGKVVNTVQGFSIPQPAEARVTAATSTVSGNQATPVTLGSLPGVTQALAQARQSGKDVVTFFYSPEVPGCRRAWDSIVSRPEFKTMLGDRVLAAADVSGADSALSYQHSVFKVPSLLILSPDGTAKSRPLMNMTSLEDVKQYLSGR